MKRHAFWFFQSQSENKPSHVSLLLLHGDMISNYIPIESECFRWKKIKGKKSTMKIHKLLFKTTKVMSLPCL